MRLQGQLKIRVMQQLLSPEYGLDVVTLDTDIIVLGDMLAYFNRYPEVSHLLRASRGARTPGNPSDPLSNESAFCL